MSGTKLIAVLPCEYIFVTVYTLYNYMYYFVWYFRGPSKNFFFIKLKYAGYSLEQCEDLNYPKSVAYKDKSFKNLKSQVAVPNMDTVFGCWLFIGQWSPNTSGKGKWFSPWVANSAPH